jgi:hypothetical protein
MVENGQFLCRSGIKNIYWTSLYTFQGIIKAQYFIGNMMRKFKKKVQLKYEVNRAKKMKKK